MRHDALGFFQLRDNLPEPSPFEMLVADTKVTETKETTIYEPMTISPASVKWSDPRGKDLPEDSAAWFKLMDILSDQPNLVSALDLFRAIGSHLVEGKKSYLIKPRIDPTGATGWSSLEDYENMKKKELMPYQITLANALATLKGD